MELVCGQFGIKQTRLSAYHPQESSKAEQDIAPHDCVPFDLFSFGLTIANRQTIMQHHSASKVAFGLHNCLVWPSPQINVI